MGLTHMAIWLTVPLEASTTPSSSTPALTSAPSTEAAGSGNLGDSWEWWHQFRALTDFHSLLGCVLEVGPELPSPQMIERYCCDYMNALM